MMNFTKIALGACRILLNQKILQPMGFQLQNRREATTLTVMHLVGWVFADADRVNCLQVGANDGVTADELRPLRLRPEWHNWLLEPNPAVLAQLQHNTRSEPDTTCLPFALGPEAGTMKLFVPDRAHLPANDRNRDNLTQLASLDRGKLEFELINLFERDSVPDSWIDAIEVRVLDWPSLLNREMDSPPDVVLIDAEGLDAILLNSFPFEQQHPTVFVFEHHWTKPEQFEEIRTLLRREGYWLSPVGHDTVAILETFIDQTYRDYPFGQPIL